MSERLHIIDALGPFFVGKQQGDTVNWSKVAFANIETGGKLAKTTHKQIVDNFQLYVKKVSSLGYDALSIDDLAHMTQFAFYDEPTKTLLTDYHLLYKDLFAIAQSYNMAMYVNTDYLFSNQAIDSYMKQADMSAADFFAEAISGAFTTFPEIAGVVLRMGEKDGNDVHGTFLSKLLLRTPTDANTLLKQLLPLFEKHKKQLIFRTWTVGAYKIGDLIWNEKTYDTVFGSIRSDALIISMKFGDTDFMRYLALNPLFFRNQHKKILELQTRREWEGMGTLPSFVGWDYEKYLKELQGSKTVIGIHVWCQTGGWAKHSWTNLTYLKDSSFWNELNTEVVIRIADGEHSVESAVTDFCKQHAITDTQAFLELLELSEVAIKKGLYVADIAKQTLYFRRTRIPPLLWLTWDKLYVPQAVVYLHRMLLPAQATFIADGDEAVQAAEAMLTAAKKIRLNTTVLTSLEFELATLILLAELRRYIAGHFTARDIRDFNKRVASYEKQFPQHYTLPRLTVTKSRRIPKVLLSPFVRKSLRYRKRDRIFIKTSAVQARLLRLYLKRSRSHLADQSMGIETLFK